MSDEARELMRMADAPQDCRGCPALAVLRDAVTLALLRGGLGQVLTGIPSSESNEGQSPAPSSGQRAIAGRRTGQAGIERVAKVRATLYGRLAAIDVARKRITAIARDGDGMTTAVQVEIRHRCGIIARETQRAREVLAATALSR